MKRLILGLVVGMLIGSAATVFADEAAEKVTATIAKLRFVVNGEERDVQTEQLVVMGTTYLPVPEVANMLGYDVVYRADSRTIEFYTANPVQLNPSEEEQTLVEEKTMLTGRELVELLAEKYPQYADTTNPQIYLSPDGTLKIGENIYHVTIHENKYVDVSPLIEDGVLSSKDIQ